MLRHFQPWTDYKKLIEMQANSISFRLSREDSKKHTKKSSVVSQKSKNLKIGRK